jgi:elongation factor P--beta-lysine ligase
VAMGFDRLVALATGSESVAETLAFTHRQRAPAGR